MTAYLLPVEARQVTAENMAEVAEWCGGSLGDEPFLPGFYPLVSDWVLRNGNGFYLESDAEFRAAGYVEAETELPTRAELAGAMPGFRDHQLPACDRIVDRWPRIVRDPESPKLTPKYISHPAYDPSTPRSALEDW